MPLTDELLNTIRETELQQLDYFATRGSTGSIIKTSRLTYTIYIPVNEPTIFKSRTTSNAIKMGIPLTFMGLLFLRQAVTGSAGPTGTLIFSSLLSVACFLLYQYVSNKRFNYTITLTRQGISLGTEFFNWANIQETALLYLPNTVYLVILFNDNQYEKWDLSRFKETHRYFTVDFNEKLATYIEYFRAMK